jgi:tetratricopeptide (TPR) repeat protein
LSDVDESATVDCKSGCGLRFCSTDCRDPCCSKRGHAEVCKEVQHLLAMFKAKKLTHNAAADLVKATKDGGHKQAQVGMLAADLFVTKGAKSVALRESSDALRQIGAYRLALESAEAALTLAEKGTVDAARCFLLIGNVLQVQGKHDAAMEKYEAALQIMKKVFGEEHAGVAGCYNNIGNVLQAQGNHEAAMEKYEAALPIMKKMLGEEHADVAMCYNNMGIVLQEQGKHKAAMEKYEAALQIRKKVYNGEEHADVATCYNNMGAVLRAQGKHEAAMEKYEVALQIRKKVYNGEEHADVAACYNNMGAVLRAQGKHEAAMEKYEAALQIRKKVYNGEEHADVAACYNNMGNVLDDQGKHEAAMEKYEAALQIYKKVTGADSANYSSALLNLARDACVTKSSLSDAYLFAELRRIVDVDVELFNSISPPVFAFGLRDHIVLLRLMARFGQRTGETTALEQWRTNVQRLINVSHPVVHAIGSQELASMRADGRFASLTVCESERLLAALRASASPCALREATGAREQLLSSLFIDEAGAHKAQMRAVAAHSLSLLGLDGLERVDDDLVAQLLRARVLEQEVLARFAFELSDIEACDTSTWARNSVADVFVLLLNVLDQAFARLAKASGATGDELYFPCKGSAKALQNSIADTLPLVVKNALDAEVRGGRIFVVVDDKQYVRRNVAAGTDLYKMIEPSQAFMFFKKDAVGEFGAHEWLHLTTLIANDNKHIKLSQHEHSATLKDKSRGTIEQRDVTLNVSASGPSPDLTNWTLFHRPALVEALHDDAERRAVSRLARKFLTGLERGDDGNTVPVGGVTENKYLQHFHVGAYDLFFVPPRIADMDDEALRRELVKDLARFDLVRKFSGKIDWLLAPERGDDFLISLCKRELEKAVGKQAAAVVDLAFVGEVKLALDGRKQRAAAPDTMPELFLSRFVDAIRSFLRMRIDWQTPSKPLVDASNEAQIDLVKLMRRAIDNTCKLVVEMVDKRVALGHAAIKSGAGMFVAVDWLALSDAEARNVARDVDEVRASAWGVVDDLVKNLLANSDFAESASAYKSLHAIGRALENDDNVDAFAKLWERVIDLVTASDSDWARSLASVFAVRLRDTLLLRATTCELSQLLIKIDKVASSFKIELPSLAGFDDDLLSQLKACMLSVHKLRVQSLQLRCGGGRDVLLRNEMSVALSVALGKCRAVLEHAFTRFARQEVWARMAPPPEAYKVFQAKFPVGHDSNSWRANVLQQLGCDNDGRRLPAVDDSVWAALESVQGYKLGGAAWVDELASVVNESKHVRVRLVDDALLQAWWARGDIKAVDASFPLFVRDKRFNPWSFARECGDRARAEEMLAWLCERGVLTLTAERDLTDDELTYIKGNVSAAFDRTKLGTIAKFRAHIHAKSFLGCSLFVLEKDLEGGRLTGPLLDVLQANGFALGEKLKGDESKEAKAKIAQRSVAAIAEPYFSYDDVFGEINADYAPAAAAAPVTNSSETRIEQRDLKEDEITALRALLERLSRNVFAQLRALPDFLVASDCDAIRALTPDEIAAAKAAFPGVVIEAVAKRVANSVRARQHEEQEVDASVCVGGIEFLERCVQGAARAVAAMVSASTAVVTNADDDDDDDDDGFGK